MVIHWAASVAMGMMAGAQLENVEVEEAKNMIKQEIDSMIEEGEI